MEKLAPTIIQAIKDHLCTFEEMDARKSTCINKLEARIITIKGILRHALGEEYSVEDMRSAEELAQAVADRLKQKSAECNGENEVVSNILKSSMRPDFPWGDMSTAAIASVVLLRISELSRIEERQEKKCGELFSSGKDSIRYPEDLSESQKQVLHAFYNLLVGMDKEDTGALQREVERLKALLRAIPCQLCDIGDFRAPCTCAERGKNRHNQEEDKEDKE